MENFSFKFGTSIIICKHDFHNGEVVEVFYNKFIVKDPWIRRILRLFLGRKIVPKIIVEIEENYIGI